MKSHKKPRLIGRHIVTDPEICHGKPTFRGTRILVAHVLEQVAEGLSWEAIVQEWRSSISYEAIAEAIRLAIRVFMEHAPDVPPPINTTSSFLRTARSLNIDGPPDWSSNLENYLYGDKTP